MAWAPAFLAHVETGRTDHLGAEEETEICLTTAWSSPPTSPAAATQTDFTHYRLTRPNGAPGADVEILTFLDDHSGYAISVTCHQRVTRPAVVAVFRRTAADQGIPASVLSDNGVVFTTRFAGGRAGRDTINGFQAVLRELRVVQKHSKPNHPTTAARSPRSRTHFRATALHLLRPEREQARRMEHNLGGDGGVEVVGVEQDERSTGLDVLVEKPSVLSQLRIAG